MKRFIVGCFAGIAVTLMCFGLILWAYSTRSYFAVGGEWLLILIGLPIFGYCMYTTGESDTRERYRKVRMASFERDNRQERISEDLQKKISEMLDREG